MCWNARFRYPPLYCEFYFNISLIWTHDLYISNNLYRRKLFRHYMKNNNKTFKDVIRDGVFDCIVYSNDLHVLRRDQTILVELPLQYKKREKKLHERRIEISKIAMRGVKRKYGGGHITIPSDLIPLICAFAVPESKKYKYM